MQIHVVGGDGNRNIVVCMYEVWHYCGYVCGVVNVTGLK